MAQQEVTTGQISQLKYPPDASKEGDFTSQPLQRPTPYVGFVPFHQQQGVPTLPEPRHCQPSLALSLERPDTYRDVNLQHYQYPHEGPLRPSPARPFEAHQPDVHPHNVRPDGVCSFDLEQQPSQHMEQPTHYTPSFAETHHDIEMENAVPASNSGASAEHVDDDTHLQIASASEYPSHDQAGHVQYYPLAAASHEDVIGDPELFMTTLNNFLAALGTRLTVPRLGEMELNLHTFYFQVTARGGLEQVIRAAAWKELAEVLDVPRHLLNASFVLRKIYISLLFHYEQVYYFRVEGQLRLAPVSLPAASTVDQTGDDVSPYEVPLEMRASLKKRKRKLDPIQVFGVDPAASVGSMATGVINGKFEEGYFVTVVVGTEKLCGVLYHVSASNKAHQYANVPSLVDSIGSEGHTPGTEIQLYGNNKRKEYIRKNNPNAPKRTRTAYNIYFKEQRAKLEELYPDTKGLGKKVIEMWNNLSEEEKAPYVACGKQEREKYLAEHREKIRLQESQAPEGADDGGVEQDVGDHDDIGYDDSHDYHVSLDVDSDPHGGQPQVSEVDQVYQVYHVNGPILDSDLSGGHLGAEQALEVQEDEGNYPQEPVSDEDEDVDDDAELQETYEDDEDEQVYPGSENVFEAQDGSEYQVSDKEGDVPKDAYQVHVNDVSAHEPHGHSGSTTPKQEYYGQDKASNYVPTLPKQQAEAPQGSVCMAPFEQVPYRILDNGRVLYPHVPQGRLDALGDNPMAQQHYFPPNRYAFSQARQQVQGGEALGLPVSQDQGSLRRQDEGSYLPPFQQSQAMGANMHARKVPSDLAYQDRYAYPVPMPYYTHPPHSYHMRFPHSPYAMQMTEGTALQYAHTYAAQVHQPQASVPEVGVVGAPSQVYQAQDGGHVPHSQDGNLTPMFKHNTH